MRARSAAIHARDRSRADRLRARVREVVRDLRARGEIDGAWLIGSLAWGGFGVRSDVDIVVSGAPASEAGRIWTYCVEELGSDAGDQVDLLRLEELPEAFRARVLARGQRIDEP
ncbi:MAG: nucleotidyltransferase family protein [Polyangiaceae bacterium]